MTDDPFFKKVITFPYRGKRLTFRVAQELFSSQAIDVGTQRLLRSLFDARFDLARKILDLGCGYGPIGLSLKAVDPTRVVHLVDRDALAVQYSRANAELNDLPDVRVYGSLGYSDVADDDFDLIAANVPGRAGPTVIESFLWDAADHLSPTGTVAVVAVTPLIDLVRKALAQPDVELRYEKVWPGHGVFHYGFAAAEDTARAVRDHRSTLDVYLRDQVSVSAARAHFSIATAYGLPEFDRLDHLTELVLQALPNLPVRPGTSAAILAPGQGYVAVAVAKLLHPSAIALVDRDLLSLRVSRHNLLANRLPAERVSLHHDVGFPDGLDPRPELVVTLLDPDEGPAVHAWKLRQVTATLSPTGTVVVAGASTPVARLETALKGDRALRVTGRARDRGKALLVLRML